jgi:phospholipid transport system substrate-binding protein
MVRLATLVLAAGLSTIGTAAALEGDGPGTAAVRQANQDISALLKRRVPRGSAEEDKLAAEIVGAVRGFLDIERLGRRALASHWKDLSETQRRRFMTLLKELIERNYIGALRQQVDYQVTYTGERAVQDQLVVSTEVRARRNGRPFKIEIDYVLTKEAGRWRAFDVVTDGVGLVENYRSQFDKIIAKDGFDGLIERMAKKRDKLAR